MKQILIFLFAACFALNASAETLDTIRAARKPVKEADLNILKAAVKGWHVRLGAGFNIGGASPLPLPRSIRKIDSFNPTLCISLQGAVEKRFRQTPWGMQIGIGFENKGMKTDATVKNYHMEAYNADGSGKVEGAWTGHVKTNLDNNYLTFPVLVTYNFTDRWQMKAGPYVSWMFNGSFTGEAYDGYIRDQNPTGPKTEVTSATYDFSDELRKFHWGVILGGEFKAYKHLSVSLNLQWGLNGIFPSDSDKVTFALYPIYGNLGFNYLF